MNVIFLDFDGVITTLYSEWNLSFHHMNMIKQLCDKTGSKIIVSSSWRGDDVKSTLEKINRDPHNGKGFILQDYIVGVTVRTPYRSYYDWHNERGFEISHYLEEHPEIEHFVIIDDEDLEEDLRGLEKIRGHVVRTDDLNGITQKDLEQAINILKL